MKRYIVILLLILPFAANAQWSKVKGGNYIKKLIVGDTLTFRLDTARMRKETADSIDKAFTDTSGRRMNLSVLKHNGVANGTVLSVVNGTPTWSASSAINKYILDPAYPQTVTKQLSGAADTVYNLLYMAQDIVRTDGAVSSFSNAAADSARFSWAFNNTALQFPAGHVLYQIQLLSSKAGSIPASYNLLGVYEHPPIGTADSLTVSVKVVSRGGAWYLTLTKFATSGLANPFTVTNTGGTNFLEIGLAAGLFPPTGTVVSLKLVLITGRKRY